MDFKRYVNEAYLNDVVLEEMRKAYFYSGMLKLDEFLKKEIYNELVKLFEGIKGEHVKIIDRYSYFIRNDLNGVEKLFYSNEFLDFAKFIIGEEFEDVDLKVKIFGKGDYTLLHDSSYETAKFEFFFIFSKDWNKKYGGEIVYTDNKEKGKTFIFPVIGNSLVLIKRKGLGKFIKYLNHFAENRNFILIDGILK